LRDHDPYPCTAKDWILT